MRRFLHELLDFVLPRRERTLRAAAYTLEDISLAPMEHHQHGTAIVTLTSYRSRAVEDAIRALKYERSSDAAALLASVLADYLREEIAHIRSFSTKPVVLVPMSLHTSRERERGFNQVTRILEALPAEFRNGTLASVETRVLVRIRATAQQTRLSRQERLRNVAGAFALNAADDSVARGAHIFLVDDVTTTGSTLAEAAKPLRSVATSLTLLAVAHA